MLAYLIDEQPQPTPYEQASVGVTLVVPAPDDQGVWAQVAYRPRRSSTQRAGSRRACVAVRAKARC